MKTVDQMIAALEAFKAEHGGDAFVVKEASDPMHYEHLGAYSTGVEEVVPDNMGGFEDYDRYVYDGLTPPTRVFVIN